MASKNLKGITIEIDGNTTKLNDALKNTNKVIYSTNSELKSLNAALKLDPKNTELLAQKQELLKKNIQESTIRLNQLKEAQRQMGAYNNLTEEQKENYRLLSVEITKSENAIRNMNSELKKTNSIDLSKIGGTLKNVGDIAEQVIKKVGQVVTGVSTAMAGVVAAGVKSYADSEQNVGGVETLFGKDSEKVIANAKKAYETAGVSANEYMAGVTSFSASLLQSLGNDTSKAADVADMAFRDMSDNANKFGTDMGSIQNAYQGFAKQNYTMLDNLKLGYGGTKTEMERLLSDAEKFSGVHYDINNLSDVYNAIHVIQEEMKITGTTSQEAATTISGSATSMKAAFDNFLNGTGGPDQLSSTINNFIDNVSNTIVELTPKLTDGITRLVNDLMPKVFEIINNTLPLLFNAAQGLLSSLLQMIQENVQPIANMVVSLMTSLVNFILENLPLIVETGLQIIVALATGIADKIPELVPTIVDVVLKIVDVLLDNIDLIIEAAIKIVVALTEGIMNALPNLIARLPEIIIKICSTLLNLLPQILSTGLRIAVEIGLGIVRGIPALVSKIPQVITSIVNALKQGFSKMLDIGKNLVKGIWEGISGSLSWIKDKISGWVGNVMSFIKKLFGIHSPSTVMRDVIGVNLTKGIGKGFEKGMPDTLKDVNRAMSQLNTEVKASINPIINPSVKQVNDTASSNQEPVINNYTFNFQLPSNASPSEYARQVRKKLQYMNLMKG